MQINGFVKRAVMTNSYIILYTTFRQKIKVLLFAK